MSIKLAIQFLCTCLAYGQFGCPLRAQETHGEAAGPLAAAHAHNDYAHARPLLDALACGFSSVEADIFLRDGTLLVGHTRLELTSRRTLEDLYLKPLAERILANDGNVYRTSDGQEPASFTLLIDFKSDGEDTYRALNVLLRKYRDILCEFRDGKVTKRAVEVVISGDRPFALLKDTNTRLAFLDGRLSDLNSDTPTSLMPLISDRWGSHFSWNGKGELPAKEREKLHAIVQQAHASGQRVRFWATPETQAMWKTLYDAQVDHINTDKLTDLSAFLRARK